MDIFNSEEAVAFREELRRWLDEKLPPEMRDQTLGGTTLDPDLQRKWHRMLYEKGWIAPELPKDVGGAGFTETEQFIFNYEYGLSGAPRLKTKLLAVNMLVPILLQFGTEEQQQRFIPGILSGDTVWCQGFSEPNAGSDLASLKTSARIKDGELIVNGQKIWTTMADHADWMFMLVRTDSSGKKQEGITFLLVDLDSPGITIRPIEALTDEYPFCEVFFDDVRVPLENVVGNINEGWKIARAILEHERLNAFPVGELFYALETVKKNARKSTYRGKRYIEDEVFRRKLALLEIDCKSLLYTFLRILLKLKAGSSPGPESSILKVCGAELYQQVLDLNIEVLGPYAQSWYNREELGNDIHQATVGWINSRSLTIWGGTSEIQRTIIATRVLGLPRK